MFNLTTILISIIIGVFIAIFDDGTLPSDMPSFIILIGMFVGLILPDPLCTALANAFKTPEEKEERLKREAEEKKNYKTPHELDLEWADEQMNEFDKQGILPKEVHQKRRYELLEFRRQERLESFGIKPRNNNW